jgi:hypothetical protein
MATGPAEAVAREFAVAALAPQAELELDVPDIGLPSSAKLVALQEKRRPGRPPGSPNKRVEDVARALLAKGDPLAMLWAMAMTPADEYVAAGLSLADALTTKRLAADGALPFLHQRKPVAVEVGGVLPMLVMADPRAYAAPAIDGGEIKEIQVVSEGAGGQV